MFMDQTMQARFFLSLDEPDSLEECAKQNEQRNTEMFDWKHLMSLSLISDAWEK